MSDPLSVPVPPKSLGDYAAIAGVDVIDELRARAEQFKGARVLHVNSTAFGGGVAELNYTIVPLMRDLGILADWHVIAGSDAFYGVTKAMHNGLQGMTVPFTDEMTDRYEEITKVNAEMFQNDYDIVIIHDSQPAGLLDAVENRRGKWIWRCHIDLTETYAPVWDFLKPKVDGYDAAVFTMQDFVKPDLKPRIALIPPSIDPLATKNIPLEQETIDNVMTRYGIDASRPLIVQVSRYDPWKDPNGVIDAFRIVRADIPGAQLALIASMAHDDPEGWEMYEKVRAHAAGDPDIHLLSNLDDVGALAVNAFQRAADVVVQKSLREGFGLVVAEAMWKRKPMVAGDAGGIRLQVKDGETGWLVRSVEECAAAVLEVFKAPEDAAQIAERGREHIKAKYLSTRHIMDWLELFETITA